MKIKHMLVEGFCDGKEGEKSVPCEGKLDLGIHCFGCPLFSYAQCPNEFAVSGNDGGVDRGDFIGFGGDMEPISIVERDKYIDKWIKICKKKLDEAYNEYMNMMH